MVKGSAIFLKQRESLTTVAIIVAGLIVTFCGVSYLLAFKRELVKQYLVKVPKKK